MQKARLYKILQYCSIIVLMILAILPATRWIITNQFGYIASRKSTVPFAAIHYDKIAAEYPDNYSIQLAYAVRDIYLKNTFLDDKSDNDDRSGRVDRLETLVRKFPDNPSAYAALISIKLLQINAERPDIVLSANETNGNSNYSQPNPEVVDELLRDTSAGERLNPDNAFFPYINAYVLFAARKDEMALNALHRASLKHHFNNYGIDVATGSMLVLDKSLGAVSGIAHMNASPFFVGFARIRSVARIGLYKAIIQEQKGNTEKGYAIRKDIFRLASLMRAESKTAIEVLVSNAVSSIAMDRPGGEPRLKRDYKVSNDEFIRMKEQRFYDYLSKIGHREDIDNVMKENDCARLYKKTITDYISTHMTEFNQIYLSWYCGFLWPIVIFWLLLLSALAPLLSLFVPRLNQPATSNIVLATIIGLILTFAGIAYFAAPDSMVTLYIIAACLVNCVILAICLFFMSRRSHNIAKSFIAILIGAVIFTSISLLIKPQSIAAIYSLFSSAMLTAQGDINQTSLIGAITSGFITAALSMLLIITLAYSKRKNVPISKSIARSFAVSAYIALIVYAGTVLYTFNVDRNTDYVMTERYKIGELQYYAKALNRQLPEPAIWKD